jgi:N-carbamoyl-L-amino-acid hydrolase
MFKVPISTVNAKALFVGLLGALLLPATPASADTSLEASADRMQSRIEALSQFGRNADGGVDRVAYSDADLAGRGYIIEEMKKLGLKVSTDTAGNILGKRDGTEQELDPILFGSHIDSVPGGGNYDGDVGVIGALEVISILQENSIHTRHPLEVVVFSDEEGGMPGSLGMSGRFDPELFNTESHSGLTIAEGLDRLGGDHTRIDEAARAGKVHAFVELHIEQGGLLEQKKLAIGVVEGIVGIRWWKVTATGVANHGGTTPMPGRRDALVASARLIMAINDIATTMDGRQVATVGKIQAFPGAPNVIPGRVEFSLEIRDLESAKIQQVFDRVQAEANRIAAEWQVSFDFGGPALDLLPAPTDPGMRELIEESVTELGFSYQLMPSGAGHDAQNLATITPTGMIFVPSRGGISHSPQEHTAPIDMARGAHVLYRTVMKLDKQLFE